MSTPATPVRALIITEVVRRMRTIKCANGFATDAGQCVMVGIISLGPGDEDCAIALVPGDTEPLGQRTIGKVSETLPLQIAALAKVESYTEYADAWLRVEAIIGDIKQAMETEDRTLDGTAMGDIRRGATQTLEREEGGQTVGALITYEAPYYTAWGAR